MYIETTCQVDSLPAGKYQLRVLEVGVYWTVGVIADGPYQNYQVLMRIPGLNASPREGQEVLRVARPTANAIPTRRRMSSISILSDETAQGYIDHFVQSWDRRREDVDSTE